jgi:dTDP-4-amino-4,6-dideoxygalactose transaminase
MNKIPQMNLARLHQKYRTEIDAAIKAVIDSGKFINGPQVKQFEEAFALASGLKQCIGCANGTDAILVLLKALGIGPGDDVVLPTMTFIATSEMVTAVGANVVFADILPDSYCLDPQSVRKVITKKTKAIIAVHLHGNVAPVDELVKIAAEHKAYLIEDSAQAHLAKLKGKPIGSFGVAATFSFFPGKNLGALGDAGAICTNDEALALKLRKLVNHGRMDKYKHDLEGYNMRIDTLQAAVLLAKLPYLVGWTETRREKAGIYRNLLHKANLQLPIDVPNMYNVYHLFVVRVKNRDAVLEKLQKAGIEAGIHYPIPLHLQPAYADRGHQKGAFPVAEICAEEFITLPLCSELTQAEQEYVVESLVDILR